MRKTIETESALVEIPLGQKLKRYRNKRHLCLFELSECSGISKSLVSQIERSLVNPSISTVRSLAKGLGIPVFLLFLDDDPNTALVRRDQRRRISMPDSDVVREFLTPENRQEIVMLTMNLGPGAISCPEATQRSGEECVYARTGSITVYLGDRVIPLHEGDSLYFDAIVPHHFANTSDRTAEVICCFAPGVDG